MPASIHKLDHFIFFACFIFTATVLVSCTKSKTETTNAPPVTVNGTVSMPDAPIPQVNADNS